MTTVVKSHTTGTHYITMSFEARRYGCVYIVEACPRIGPNLCGYPERQMLYAESERKKAETTFRRYCKRYATI